MNAATRIEFGDFQTPLDLARQVCALLKERGLAPATVIEPTCGLGAFLVAAADAFPKARLLGFDVNAEHLVVARESLRAQGSLDRTHLKTQDFFVHDWDRELQAAAQPVLLLGNPPWVTNAAVAGLNGTNVPVKENFQNFRGIEALTGKANFDISEWMLIRLARALRGQAATLAMLCKSGTARKLLRFAWQKDGRIAEASLHRFDAKKQFGVSVDACLLIVRFGSNGPHEAAVFDRLEARQPATHLGLAGADLVADIKTYRSLKHLEGLCPYQWRSGVKHDCASVMELRPAEDGSLTNKLGERLRLEPECLYPLLKCSDLANGRIVPSRTVIITQKRVGEETDSIARRAPRTWDYLQAHAAHFRARKSSIYQQAAPFALFGIGDYSFAPWKVAVSGLHRQPRFLLVGPVQERPVLFDDTCYFLPFTNEAEAALVAEILNTPHCLDFLAALMFPDSKRPVTVELLQRLNLSAIAEDAGLSARWQALQRVRYTASENAPQLELVMEKRDGPASTPPQPTRRKAALLKR